MLDLRHAVVVTMFILGCGGSAAAFALRQNPAIMAWPRVVMHGQAPRWRSGERRDTAPTMAYVLLDHVHGIMWTVVRSSRVYAVCWTLAGGADLHRGQFESSTR